jgi:hypothetical protein
VAVAALRAAGRAPVMRWLIVFLLAFVLFNGLAGWLRKIGLGRLPGDFAFKWRGREVFVPLASSVLLSLIAMAIGMIV